MDRIKHLVLIWIISISNICKTVPDVFTEAFVNQYQVRHFIFLQENTSRLTVTPNIWSQITHTPCCILFVQHSGDADSEVHTEFKKRKSYLRRKWSCRLIDTKENDLHKPPLKASMTPLSALSSRIAVVKGHKHTCARLHILGSRPFTACEAEQSHIKALCFLENTHTHKEDM